MIVDVNGVPHYVWWGKLYPGGATPPPGPRDGAPRVIAERKGGGCDYLPDPDWVPTPTSTGSPSLPPAVLDAIAALETRSRRGGYQGGYDDPIEPEPSPYQTMGSCETHHSLISSLSPEQHHANMINHLKDLHGPRGS